MAALLSFIPPILLATLLVFLTKRSKSVDPADVEAVLLTQTPEGTLSVPVRALESRGGFGAMTKNSLRPALQIGPEGLRYKILRQGKMSFAEIGRIDLRRGMFGAARLLVQGKGRTLRVTLPNMGTAKAVLLALPPAVPLTPRAAGMRDGHPHV